MKKHQKHAALSRPAYGHFHRQEWAIIGAPCGEIQQLAGTLIQALKGQFELAYVDANHNSPEHDPKNPMTWGSRVAYTDQISHHRFEHKLSLNDFHYRYWFNEVDAVLVNGNHFPAKKQIVVIDPRKEDSLKRKLDRLNDVAFLLLADGVEAVYPWLYEALPPLKDLPHFSIHQSEAIIAFLQQQIQAAIPPLYGLVLAGGKSTRMGQDKGLIDYHGKPQRDHLKDLLAPFCAKTYISCRPDQVGEVADPLPDTIEGLGPMGAMLSAFRAHPDVAWLVLACDLPLLHKKSIENLVNKRSPSKVASAYKSPTDDFPEPLIAIWEPRAYPILLQFLAQGYSCPRKVLINSNIELLLADHPTALENVNDPEEMERAMEKIKEGASVT
ncbi:MAG TPA: NTP transferase domain-containing protein [Saprospiraceae bacterium]|nr:NTP transferase domain-containing protein [Saprospiraceae bacterium]HMQ83442.1 NTP transferase domain-containing protein [Saprospiraceae bacterium]